MIVPKSPTVRTLNPVPIAIAVITIMAIRGAGTVFVKRGKNQIIPIVAAVIAYTGSDAPIINGIWARNIRIAREFTKPSTTEYGINEIKRPTFKRPRANCIIPVRMVAARRYSSPKSRTRITIISAIEPVAAEIMPGLPPAIDITTAIENEAYRPTIGSTPAMIEKAIASGISASATVIPASTSPLIFESHSSFIVCAFKECFTVYLKY